MLSNFDRYEKLVSSNLKSFYHESFDDVKQRKAITVEMPDFEEFQKAAQKIQKAKSGKINPEMLPCYESPLLNYQQEQHLFRKMNFYKYKAKLVLSTINPQNPNAIKLENAENFVAKYKEIRNLLAESNFRLATQVMKHRHILLNEQNQHDTILSDAYYDVLKAVDYFNWTLGHKFSTYATWVVKKNFFRDAKMKLAHNERLSFCNDSIPDMEDEKTSGLSDERDQQSRQTLIFKLIGLLVKENIGTDRIRQAYVLENYFGVNGREKKTLEKISEEIGVTKERVRQLKEKGLEWIRSRVAVMNLDYDNEKPDESIF
jgi:RNA polymerase sigma factor (sigma-70 family)